MMSGLPLIMVEAHGPGRVALSGDQAGRDRRVAADAGPADLDPRAPVPDRHRQHQLHLGADRHLVHDRYRRRPGDPLPARPVRRPVHGPAVARAAAAARARQHVPARPGARARRCWCSRARCSTATCRSPPTCTWSTRAAGQSFSWRRAFSQRTIWLRLVGPGRVAVSSVFGHTTSLAVTRHSPATAHQW